MATRKQIPAQLRDRPFRSAEALRLGVTRRQLEGSSFRRIFRDIYVCADIQDSLDIRCGAATLLFQKVAVFCGVTAARLCEIPVPDKDHRLHVAIPATRSTVPRINGLAIHIYDIPRDQVWLHQGFAMVRPERLFLELVACLPRLDLIVAGDRMLWLDLTSVESMAEFLRRCHRRRGVHRARMALPHLERRTDSPAETRLRMLIVDAGLPRPAANRDIYDEITGVWLARPDFSYPDLKIAIQYEGKHHQENREQYVYDTERDARLELEGWIVIRIPAETLFHHPYAIVDRIRRAIAARRISPTR